MGDLTIASGFQQGYAYVPPVGSGMSSGAQSQSGVQGNEALNKQLGGVNIEAASAQAQQSVGQVVPVQISEEVRQQVHRQVRLSVAMHQNGKPLVLADVVASGYGKIYLFQAAQPLNVGAAGGGECFLNTGDLIGFSRLPQVGSATAEMKVIASGMNSCRPDAVVLVPLTALQEMLNGFSQRVEDSIRRVSACSAAGGRC